MPYAKPFLWNTAIEQFFLRQGYQLHQDQGVEARLMTWAKDQKKDIIDAFIISRKLCSVDPADALHKRTYRHELKKMEKYTAYLHRKANYIRESLDTSGLNLHKK